MRVSQSFAGYSLAEADNLRKACGKKKRELMAKERDKFVDGCETTGYGARARHPAVRHHRELRRLRLQQEPQLRLRPRHLPDRLPQGPLPGRVPRRPAHQREDQPGEGGGLPQRVPPAWASRCWCPTSTGRQSDFVPGPARGRHRGHPVRPVGGAQRGRRPGRPHRRRARRRTGPSPTSTTSATASTLSVLNKRTLESLIKAGGVRLASATPARACWPCSSRSSTRPSPAAQERDMGVMSLFGDAPATRRRRRSTSGSRSPTSDFDKKEQLAFEKEMLGLYVSDHPLHGGRGGAAPQDRRHASSSWPRSRTARMRLDRRRGHRPAAQVDEEGRPHGRLHRWRTSRLHRGDGVPQDDDRHRPQAGRRRGARRQGPGRQARRRSPSSSPWTSRCSRASPTAPRRCGSRCRRPRSTSATVADLKSLLRAVPGRVAGLPAPG